VKKRQGDRTIADDIQDSLADLLDILFRPKVCVIIPAYNESKTIRKVIKVVQSSTLVDEIVVVDDGSKDDTYKKVKATGITVIRHKNNRGKGSAMKTGLKNSVSDIVLFLDADLKNLIPKKINDLVRPILEDKADFVKSYFSTYKQKKLSRSHFLYRPLLKHTFKGVALHPVSGQYAAKRGFFEKISFRNDYGIDISILIDATMQKLRIREVCIGKLEHRKRKFTDIERINDEVIKTMVKKYHIKLGEVKKT